MSKKKAKRTTREVRALAKRPTQPQALTTAEKGALFFRSIAEEVAKAIQEGTVGLIYGPLSEWADGFKKLHATANQAGKQQIIDHGVSKGTKGSKVLLLDGGALEWEARIRGGGYDATRYEALLRAKLQVRVEAERRAAIHLPEQSVAADVDDFLAKYMKARVIYEMDDERTARALSDKVITQEELDACKLPPSYSLQRPKKVGGIGEVIDVEASDE